MTELDALLLGVLQGLTEFLPVSSSGHLALAQMLFGIESGGGATVEVALHLGTSLAVLTVFRKEIASLLPGVAALFRPPSWRRNYQHERAFRTVVLLALSAIPVAAVGFTLKEPIEELFGDIFWVGVFLIVTAGTLLLSLWAPRDRVTEGEVTPGVALAMAVAQAGAILPGISRSGSTIVAGLLAGGNREAVGSFAFLMSLAPILGASLLELPDAVRDQTVPLVPLLIGLAAAFLSGLVALLLLLSLVRNKKLVWFAPYCAALGIFAIGHALL